MDSDPIYVLTNYGQCRLEKCMCIDQDNPRFDGAWGGLACPDWVALGATDMKALIDEAKKNYKKSEKSS